VLEMLSMDLSVLDSVDLCKIIAESVVVDICFKNRCN